MRFKLLTLTGFNSFGDLGSFPLIGIVSRLPGLNSIDLSSCHITEKFFERVLNESIDKFLVMPE
jgi:hypothetical protein